MKIALVHDYIKEYGGAERVLEVLHEIYPEAPIYTTVFLPEFSGPHQGRVKSWNVRPSWFQRLPFKEKLISPLRILAPLVFENFDLREFDVVIVSATGAYNPNLIVTKPGALHLCYCHTPPRYLYGYPTAREWQKHWWGKVVGETVNFFLRKIDFLSSQRVDYFIANSKNTAQRIKKFYRRESMVIYPPVDLPSPHLRGVKAKAGYFLAGGRLARAKRIDLAVEACTKLDLPLKVFGRMFAGYGEELKKKAACPPKSAGRRWSPKVEFLGEVSDEEKAKLFAGCLAFIFPAEEEDFGITPVEAMAVGRPVIAFRGGGYLETVIEGKTGEFFDESTVQSLINVLKRFDQKKYKPENCCKQAKKFNKERFKREIKDFIKEKIHA